jgi:serine/threonine protein kinase
LNGRNRIHKTLTSNTWGKFKVQFWDERVSENCYFGSHPLIASISLLYYSHGHYRDAWLLDAPHVEEFVFKRLRLNDEFHVDYWDMHKIHREAIIMERLTASPRIINIFGHCSVTILAEAMGSEVWKDIIPGTGHVSQEELDQLDDVFPRNNYTVEQKLDMAIEMAEALADMHGFDGGVILHGDTHPEQWLLSKDGRLILNDFNNAEILDYYAEREGYCKTFREYGGFVSEKE